MSADKQTGFSGAIYETVTRIDGVSYEIVDRGGGSFQACTLQEVMRPIMARTVLGTFRNRKQAIAKLKEIIPTETASVRDVSGGTK